ncbi:MAG: putative signal transducing protein [Anaerolineae bacterium]
MSSFVGRLTLWLPWLRGGRAAAAEAPGERAGGSGGESPYMTVYVAGSLPEAHVIKGKLETEDIPVVLRYESGATVFGLVGGGLGSVEVQVPRPLEDRARTLLQEAQSLQDELEED